MDTIIVTGIIISLALIIAASFSMMFVVFRMLRREQVREEEFLVLSGRVDILSTTVTESFKREQEVANTLETFRKTLAHHNNALDTIHEILNSLKPR